MNRHKIIRSMAVAAVLILAAVEARGQGYDTVCVPGGRLPGYHYTWWYDTCYDYLDSNFLSRPYVDSTGYIRIDYERYPYGTTIVVKDEIVTHPAAITGIAMMVLDRNVKPDFSYGGHVVHEDWPRVAEYINIYQYDSQIGLPVLIDSVRWDTATPKVFKIATHIDTVHNKKPFEYCWLFEVKLDKYIEVDSMFCMGGTYNNNRTEHYSYIRPPTSYAWMHKSGYTPCNIPDYPHSNTWFYRTELSTWRWSPNNCHYGLYLAKIDYATVEVRTADSTMGTAGPSGQLSKNIYQTFHAYPRIGYRFTHWDDGNTENPRRVYITQDTVFTAYFATAEEYEVMTRVGNPISYGTVSGAGIYYEGETATVEACATVAGYRFSNWQDRDTTNPRSFVVTQDTVFTAYFVRKQTVEEVEEGDFRVSPNPGCDVLTVSVGSPMAEACRVTLHDMLGREAMSVPMPAGAETVNLRVEGLPPGVYTISLHTPVGITTRRIVLQ